MWVDQVLINFRTSKKIRIISSMDYSKNKVIFHSLPEPISQLIKVQQMQWSSNFLLSICAMILMSRMNQRLQEERLIPIRILLSTDTTAPLQVQQIRIGSKSRLLPEII